ncbi:thermonuclease family protein [Qipengyuania sp. DSG2-2]|uniref:thermonuclease family protein n=1 Tax=Qipengyuania sp. DGS2-2 TaxID=3349631 RepID=UPI0036D29AB2
MRWWLILGAVLAAWWGYTSYLAPAPDPVALPERFTICAERGSAACVIDGDTVSIGTPGEFGKARRRIRFTGYDAPELDGACEDERTAARRARSALRDWLNAAPAQVDGGEAPPFDQYGRELRAASRADGTGLADHMIDNGLASPSGWGAVPVEWCERRH